jgi:DNA topoisomerase-1
MNPAIFDQTAFDISAGSYLFRATGQIMRSPGFMAVYMEGVDEEQTKDEEENPTLPELSEGETLKLLGLDPNQHFTQPPPRFTEASLVKELEELGIGRPSTYATILSTIQDKDYAKKLEGRFRPTELGKLVNELLVHSFPNILDVKFTAQMEEELDEVEEGKRTWIATLGDFYTPFKKTLEVAMKQMRDVKKQQVVTEYRCENCGSPMVIKWGRHGEFLACSKYPECKTTREFRRTEAGGIEIAEQKVTDEKCEVCGSPMVVKRGRFGEFLACSRYPECKTTKSISLGVKCPECGGDLVARRSRKGKTFYSCSNYPKCKFALWNKPLPGPCPKCGFAILTEKYGKKTGETIIACPQKECGYSAAKT